MENVERQWKIKVFDKNKSNVFCKKKNQADWKILMCIYNEGKEYLFVIDVSLFVVCVSSLERYDL